MLQVYVYGKNEQGFLELASSSTLEMETTTNPFDEDLSSGEFSLPIDIPLTEYNRRLLGFAERLKNNNANTQYWECDVYDNNFPEMMKSKLTILEKFVDFDYRFGTFKASISGTKGLFGSTIKRKNLRDLELGGPINFAYLEKDSRHFATEVMRNEHPQWYYVGFAPIAIENFFQKDDNYTDEFLAKDTVNYVLSTGTGPNDWVFGRPSSADATVAVNEGNREYIDARTIPFLKLRWVFEKAFTENGYSVSGDLINDSDFNDLYIFNNQSIDLLSYTSYKDDNREINPSKHVPDMLVTDFIKAVMSFFNVYPIFNATNVSIRYRQNLFKDRTVLDISSLVDRVFNTTIDNSNQETGYKIDYNWDEKDDYRNDRVKDITTKILCATVALIDDLNSLDIGRSFTTNDIVYVQSENMYYVVTNAISTPVLFEPFSEGLAPVTVGDGAREINLGMGTLCQYVEWNEPDAVYYRRNYLGTRQPGSYRDNSYNNVVNPFSLRIFYIKMLPVGDNTVPVSFNHNTNEFGVVLEPWSLAIDGTYGRAENFHKSWQNVQEGRELVKVIVNGDKKFMRDIKNYTMVQIKNIIFLIQKIEYTVPISGRVVIYLKPI